MISGWMNECMGSGMNEKSYGLRNEWIKVWDEEWVKKGMGWGMNE